jgi:asparagine synthase (glutamine-hydrolysing)
MCGLAGIVRADAPVGPEHEAVVRRMCALQAYRGPDDSGVVSIGKACLGSLRLSIIDLSPAGHMPMSDASGRWWIVYNGEVYNFAELRTELEALGHEFRSRTDTEVVLHSFIEWGEKSLSRFVGMFAFAIFDGEEGTATLVRDRYGIKPLYFASTHDEVRFSSEMKALVETSAGRKVDRQSLIEWSLYRNVDSLSEATLVEGIQTLLPGHLAVIRGGRIATREYYSATRYVDAEKYRAYGATSENAIVEKFDATLRECVRARLISDVPVGTLVSGGLDSSLVTAIAAGYSDKLTGFHVSVQGQGAFSETPYAERVAEQYGIPLLSCEFSGEIFRRELPRIIYLSDLPLTHPNSVAYALICRVAREHGVIVLLSGEGADELFGGYGFRYRRYQRMLKLEPLLKRLPESIRMGLGLLGFASVGLPVTGFHFRELLPHTAALIDSYARRDWQTRCAAAYEFVAGANDRAVLGAMLADLGDFLTPLLRRLDRMSMSASVECRVPFLDHRMVHEVVNLPLSLRLHARSDKWILKRIAAKYLPSSIVERKKAGFPLPMKDYLAPLAHMALFDDGFCIDVLGFKRSGLSDTVGAWTDNVVGFFSLVSLEIWGRLFFLGQTVEQVDRLIEHVEAETAVRRYESAVSRA